MELQTRKTHSFINIKVDEIETTIFKSDKNEIDYTIRNLLSVVEDLASLTGNSIQDYIDDL